MKEIIWKRNRHYLYIDEKNKKKLFVTYVLTILNESKI